MSCIFYIDGYGLYKELAVINGYILNDVRYKYYIYWLNKSFLFLLQRQPCLTWGDR